ncbi:mannose-6-phosphate isomerase [Arthrobacter sp. MN05-02]|nr:mannose-6-phosphate isomerase [Arthrobacter sp. MN05-02]
MEARDVDGDQGSILNGPLAGATLSDLVRDHPEDLMGRGWSGDSFPLLTKFIDAAGMLPVHLHANDDDARTIEGAANGKTEAWHILEAAPGATALCGVREGIGRDELREALLRQDFDAVLRRIPVAPGQTLYVPEGTPHSFGPDTLVYEIEQSSNLQQHAMPWRMEDGSGIGDHERAENIDLFLRECSLGTRPSFTPGLMVLKGEGVRRTFLAAGPHFALERWTAESGAIAHGFRTALIVSNAGAPVRLRSGSVEEDLGRAESIVLPAVLGEMAIDGPADVLVGYLPDIDRNIRAPLTAAGYGPDVISTLGEC